MSLAFCLGLVVGAAAMGIIMGLAHAASCGRCAEERWRSGKRP